MIEQKNIKINSNLFNFVNTEVLNGLHISSEDFWNGFSDIVDIYYKKNNDLLDRRENLQSKINEWHITHRGKDIDLEEYKKFLKEINYIVNEGPEFKITTSNVDKEISTICGPQLVVPITNARFALNAVNARWGSFYDALYGTDALGDMPEGNSYNAERGERVVKFAKSHLDKLAPLVNTSWNEINKIQLLENKIVLSSANNSNINLENNNQIIGWRKNQKSILTELILLKNNLHCRILINANDAIGKNDPANIADILIESAISTILDCEDSVATVDADDKILAYRNWLGLVKGDLQGEFKKNNQVVTRTLNKDIKFSTNKGSEEFLKTRSLMIIRYVGHLMTTPAILNIDNQEIGEGVMDAIITTLIATYDFKKETNKNSEHKSIYIVKPKMHGPEEVEFTDQLFSAVESLLDLPKSTIKIGIMDEERRTSVNLKECIRAAKSRVAFINTGFLDRTGDEIHTAMQAGSFSRKDFIKRKAWIGAYENLNVDIGLECGLQGRAQIGKGMWAMPDAMAAMIEQKIDHPKSGANCAWVPSPTAATLHALHYHKIDVIAVQDKIKAGGRRAHVNAVLDIPLAAFKKWSEAQIMREVENNAQGILGYVVRWIVQGIGCSKVPDINNVGLMEDRATCRISAQHIANWLHHDIVSKDQVMGAMKKMATVVDEQNAGDSAYRPMAPNFDGIAFQAACDLVFEGRVQPSGYTEPVLHQRRLELKAQGA